MASRRWTRLLDGSSLPEKALIGGKAWSVARMGSLGLPVPPAFVITTGCCLSYLQGGQYPPGLAEEILSGIAWLEQQTGRTFGGGTKPLLLSVRSGAAISMPGMMDTVLNLGINDDTERALAAESGIPAFAADTHRRFAQLYAGIVLKTPIEGTEQGRWREQLAELGLTLPATSREQLEQAVRAVFDSWNTRRAKRYREHHNIPHDLGTAVTVQAMVFGNLDERSGTGVVFSRNPLTGDPVIYGEYLPRAQGEDVVSGRFTPLTLAAMHEREPAAHAELLRAAALLEKEHGDIQDIEFTVQSGKLYLLQSRSAKRAPDAAIRAAVDMVKEGLVSVDVALSRISPEQVQQALQPRLRHGATDGATVVAQGEGACPGVAVGAVVCDPDEAERRAAAGEAVVLVRATTSPDDIHGMIAARAVVTEQGGSTSHAAVVSRALGRPCVVGVGSGGSLTRNAVITVDGKSGTVYAGALPVEVPTEASDSRLVQVLAWARERCPIQVLRASEAAGVSDCTDIDDKLASGDVAKLPEAIAGATRVRGRMLANPEMARVAANHGVNLIVTDPVLPALLSIVRGNP